MIFGITLDFFFPFYWFVQIFAICKRFRLHPFYKDDERPRRRRTRLAIFFKIAAVFQFRRQSNLQNNLFGFHDWRPYISDMMNDDMALVRKYMLPPTHSKFNAVANSANRRHTCNPF
ncbi:MAG: hypothetical protein DMG13_31445 [Acidobacteria bacterium]|nr:MAG: hypothetical protein DMG13_31445 [Acidobacteriota bacterium]